MQTSFKIAKPDFDDCALTRQGECAIGIIERQAERITLAARIIFDRQFQQPRIDLGRDIQTISLDDKGRGNFQCADQSDKETALRLFPLLRTVRASFPTHGSSRLKASFPTRLPCLIVEHKTVMLTSPPMRLPDDIVSEKLEIRSSL